MQALHVKVRPVYPLIQINPKEIHVAVTTQMYQPRKFHFFAIPQNVKIKHKINLKLTSNDRQINKLCLMFSVI